MRKVLHLSLLFLCLPLTAVAQQLTTGTIPVFVERSNSGGEIAPPKLNPPVAVEGDADALLFRWEQIASGEGLDVVYEFVLSDADGVVYTVKTKDNNLIYGLNLPHLIKGGTYTALINTYLTDNQKTQIIYGTEQALIFAYIPECSPPLNVRVHEYNNEYAVIEWDGRLAVANEVEYIIRYWAKDQKLEQAELKILHGNQARLEGLDNSYEYIVEVQKVCYWKDGTQVLSESSTLILNKVVADFPVNCGDPYVFPPCVGPFLEIGNWQSLSVGGFPIQVLTNQPGPTGGWSGTGRILLPFGVNRNLKVKWDGVHINAQGRICGTVKGVQDLPPNLPMFNTGPAVFGDEICQNAPSTCGFEANGLHCETNQPWDPFGFGQNDLYIKEPPYEGWQPGMPSDSILDPNGFDANGIHFETQTEFGPNGCSQAGFDSLGQPCSADTIPYYWLQDTPAASEAANELLEDVKDSLELWIHTTMVFWQNTYQDTTDQIESECDGIRNTMEGLIIALDYTADRELIFGPGDVYFAKGMWKKFDAEPKVLNVELPRNGSQVLLESKHIDLYRCDKKLESYGVFKGIIDSLITNNSIPDIVEIIEDLISQLPESEADYFAQHHDSLQNWIKIKLKKYLKNTYCDGTCKVEQKPSNPFHPTNEDDVWGNIIQGFSAPDGLGNLFKKRGSLASVNEGDWLGIFKQAKTDANLTAYLNGDEYINGIHRAFYVEALGLAKNSDAFFTSANPELMPIDISNLPSDGRTYSVWLDNIQFTASNATLDAYFILELPNSGKKIAFSALGVQFSPFGLLNTPSIKLQLASDVKVRLNNAVQLTLKANANTFVVFDCNGYGGVELDLDVEVCRKYVKPLDPGTLAVLPDPERVHTQFHLFLPTIDELYFEVNIDPFVITGIEDFKWIINGIVVDFSDTRSPQNLPPQGYASPFANANGFSPLWRGIYMAQLTVQMPNQFNNGAGPLNVGVEKVLIDNMGVSGKVFASPLLSLAEGNAGGWAFSVDTFSLTVLANQPVNAGFNGVVHVPIFSGSQGACNTGAPVANDCFKYKAFIEPSPEEGHPVYRMTVNTGASNWCVNMWKAGQVTINSGSQIDMLIENGQFKVSATLSGKVKITEPLSGNIDIGIPEITFQNLIIKNESPYFTSGTWGFPFPNTIGASFGGFGLHISKIAMDDNAVNPALTFNAGFKISDDSIGLKADGSFLIKGHLNTIAGRQRWVYESFQVTDIQVNGSFPGVEKIEGKLTFYEGHATYGTGWRGGVVLVVKGLAEVSAVAQFGRIKTPTEYKYFFVDALACLDKGFGGALKLKGFGGGVYYHMNRPAQSMPLTSGCTGNPAIPAGLGQSLSGLQYTPDISKGLGIKATVAIAAAVKESAFSGNATLELLFNAGGGLSDLWIYGNARFMEAPNVEAATDTLAPSGSAVGATLDIHFDFNNDVMHGELDVYLNVAGGSVHGSGPNGLMAHAVMHIENKVGGLWFIKIGTPEKRAGLVVHLPVVGEVGNIGAYLQIGKELDQMPAIPSEIASITGAEGSAGLSTLMGTSKREGASGGNGFLFGADMSIGKKRMEYLIFYAGLRARLGFDIALLNYGSNAICQNTGAPVGINGWYASGQLYAGLWGEMGINVKVFGKRKEFTIFDIAVAASLQASLPNPFWAKGAVGGDYDLLGGIIKGHCNFDVTFGEKCQIVGADNPLDVVAVVQRISPENGTSPVIVDCKPEIYFNFPMGETFSLNDPNGNSISYKATLESAKIKYYGLDLSAEIKWAADRRSLILEPEWILPGNDTIDVVILSHVDSSGITIYEEERIARLATGPGLKHIPASNVQGSYPSDGQFNFFSDQIQDRTGYILLKHGQPDLFWKNDNSEKMVVRFKAHCGAETDVPLEYDGIQEKIEFEIPQGFFTPGGIYRMQVVQKGKVLSNPNAGGAGERPGGGGCLEFTDPEEVVLYTAYFRTSQYSSFGAKMTAWNNAKTITSSYNSIKAEASIEPFDPSELNSMGDGQIDLRAVLTGNTWYNDQIKPKLYNQDYCATINYCFEEGHVAPALAIEFKPKLPNTTTPPFITKTHWVNGAVPDANVVMELNCKTIEAIYYDWQYLHFKAVAYVNANNYNQTAQLPQFKDKCASLCGSNCTLLNGLSTIKSLFCMGEEPPEPPTGNYPIIMRYRMPGTSNWGSEWSINLPKN